MTQPDRFDDQARKIADSVRPQILQHASSYELGEAHYDRLRTDILYALRDAAKSSITDTSSVSTKASRRIESDGKPWCPIPGCHPGHRCRYCD